MFSGNPNQNHLVLKKQLEILFEDTDLVAVNKPSGILSIPDRYDASKPNMFAMLKRIHEEIFIVHRIDRETSGILLFAKSAEAHKELNRQFEQRLVEKKYLAVVDGKVLPPEGTIDLPLAPSKSQAGRMVVANKGKEAISHFRTIEGFKRFTLLKVKIETGRMHQIRVHLQSIRHPLLVDPFYGKREAFYLSEIKGKQYNKGKYEEERPFITRPPLHAAELSFQHPITKETIKLEAPIPKDIKALLNQLRKWGK